MPGNLANINKNNNNKFIWFTSKTESNNKINDSQTIRRFYMILQSLNIGFLPLYLSIYIYIYLYIKLQFPKEKETYKSKYLIGMKGRKEV